jgi:hypothetical protein
MQRTYWEAILTFFLSCFQEIAAIFPVVFKSLMLKNNYVMLVVCQMQEDFCRATISVFARGKPPLTFYEFVTY